jgi:hypothetical protein
VSAEIATFPEPGDEGVTPTEPLGPLEGEENPHVLVLGDAVFSCVEELPVRTLVRYASGGFEQTHHLLVKLIHPDDLDRMWDAWEAMADNEAAFAALGEAISTYSERPTDRPSPSRSGSKHTKHR